MSDAVVRGLGLVQSHSRPGPENWPRALGNLGSARSLVGEMDEQTQSPRGRACMRTAEQSSLSLSAGGPGRRSGEM